MPMLVELWTTGHIPCHYATLDPCEPLPGRLLYCDDDARVQRGYCLCFVQEPETVRLTPIYVESTAYRR